MKIIELLLLLDENEHEDAFCAVWVPSVRHNMANGRHSGRMMHMVGLLSESWWAP